MPFEIIRNDITKMRVDAIVNASNPSLLGDGGVDGAIHRAAGGGLLAECLALGGCKTGQAKITKGYNLPCRYIIHTVGPVWHGGGHGERDLLASCYTSSLSLAAQYQCQSVAVPLISTGAYGFPRAEAMKIATDIIRDFLMTHEMLVSLVVYDRHSFAISQRLYAHIRAFIDDAYVGPDYDSQENIRHSLNFLQHSTEGPEQKKRMDSCSTAASPKPKKAFPFSIPGFIRPGAGADEDDNDFAAECSMQSTSFVEEDPSFSWTSGDSLRDTLPFSVSSLRNYMAQMDEGFRDLLLRLIDQRGMTDAECYKRANVDRKLFNKIKNNPDYRPSKTTVLAFAVALRLTLKETEDMLKKAGFSLSHSNKFDLIVEYFILQGNYDIFLINEVLFSFEQQLLGSVM